MAKFPGLLMVVGDKIRISAGCRQIAFNPYPYKQGVKKENLLRYVNEAILNNGFHGQQWVGGFKEIVSEGYDHVTRIRSTRKKEVIKLLESALVEFKVEGNAAGFKGGFPGDESLAYILHGVGRDKLANLDTDVPIGCANVGISEKDVFFKKLYAEGFRCWVKNGKPNIGKTETEVVRNATKFVKMPIELTGFYTFGHVRPISVRETSTFFFVELGDVRAPGGYATFKVRKNQVDKKYRSYFKSFSMVLNAGSVLKFRNLVNYSSKDESVQAEKVMFIGKKSN